MVIFSATKIRGAFISLSNGDWGITDGDFTSKDGDLISWKEPSRWLRWMTSNQRRNEWVVSLVPISLTIAGQKRGARAKLGLVESNGNIHSLPIEHGPIGLGSTSATMGCSSSCRCIHPSHSSTFGGVVTVRIHGQTTSMGAGTGLSNDRVHPNPTVYDYIFD